ncbi:MAG: hypothetical protein LBH03_05285 [Holophagales bacterium]|jgi:hypothetical protein|nr:hypothetical protein [Holophagales bacterium]
MIKKAMLISLLLPAAFGVSQEAPVINGAVSKSGMVDTKITRGLNRYNRLVKIADSKGDFLCSLELSGYALRDVLDRIGIKKQNDGFDRPLDTFITAKGGGNRVLFSFGEVFLCGDEGPLLADSAKMILPHRHPPLNAGKNDPTVLLDVKKRNSIDLSVCISCHEGPTPPKLHFPKGWMLIAAQDGFAGRFVENLTEINVSQVGIEVKDTRATSRDSVVETPTIIGPDGRKHAFELSDFEKLPRVMVRDAGIGEGKGYRGIATWEGVPLKGLLRHLLPEGTDPQNTYVLVTAVDGYRAVYSGMEVFNSLDEKCALLIDRKNGDPMGKGAGLYNIIPRSDFFVDRNVRMVKEIRLLIVGDTRKN